MPGLQVATPAVAPAASPSTNSAIAAAIRSTARAAISMRGLLVGGGDDQRELVAAVAGGDVVGADAAAQRGADAAQHLVAGQVAVLLVDLLEVVEVDQHERGRLGGAAGGALDLAPELLVQRGVVEAAGERVGLRRAGEVGVGAGVAAGDAGQLRERLQHREVLGADAVRALPADAEHAAQLAVPAERHRERRAHAPERRVRRQRGDRLVVVGQHRAAALDDLAGEPGAGLQRPADELGRQARDAADDEARRPACRGRRRRCRRRAGRSPPRRCGRAAARARATR